MTRTKQTELTARDPNPAFRGTPAQLAACVATLDGMARQYRAAGLTAKAQETSDRASAARAALWLATAPVVVRAQVVGLDRPR